MKLTLSIQKNELNCASFCTATKPRQLFLVLGVVELATNYDSFEAKATGSDVVAVLRRESIGGPDRLIQFSTNEITKVRMNRIL